MTGLSRFISGAEWGNAFWAMTLLCGFLVLGLGMVSTVDGILRRWVDVFWTANARLRKLDPKAIRLVYFRVLLVYSLFGLIMLWATRPVQLIKFATLGYNFALGFSCIHTLALNLILLPRELRPNWFIRVGLVLAGIFFTLLGAVAAYSTLQELGAL